MLILGSSMDVSNLNCHHHVAAKELVIMIVHAVEKSDSSKLLDINVIFLLFKQHVGNVVPCHRGEAVCKQSPS